MQQPRTAVDVAVTAELERGRILLLVAADNVAADIAAAGAVDFAVADDGIPAR